MAIAYVSGQSGGAQTGSGTGVASFTYTASGAVSAGNTIILMATAVDSGGNPFSWTVSDNVNTYHAEVEATDTEGVSYVVFVTQNSGSPTTFTLTSNGGHTIAWTSILVDVFSGVASVGSLPTLDGVGSASQVNSGTGTDAILSGSFTPANSGDTIWCGAGSSVTGMTPGTGFTGGTSLATSFIRLYSEYKLSGVSGAQTASWTNATNGASGFFDIVALALVPAAAAGCVPTRTMLGVGCSLLGADAIERNEIQTRRRMMTARWRERWLSSLRS